MFFAIVLFLAHHVVQLHACTAMIVDAAASASGFPMTTHTNDCAQCDFRIGRIPRHSYAKGTRRPVFQSRLEYPRFVGSERGYVYEPAQTDYTIGHNWNLSQPVDFVDQVEETYSYIDGTYGLVNEWGLAMGESTCTGRFWDAPEYAGGKALFDIGELGRIAMERCKTARCAIETMGYYAEKYGYYGALWQGPLFMEQMEAGEAMAIIDGIESWVFHILPDPTGMSAIWGAERLKKGHFAIVANEFIIEEMDLENKEYFMASENILTVAQEQGLWTPEDGHINFQKCFAASHPHARYTQRRTWRGLSLAAPSLKLGWNLTSLELPFSVQVDTKLSLEDIIAWQRDHFEGTIFDMTQGMAAGPWGSPNRYDLGNGTGGSTDHLQTGSFERAISIFRAGYSYVIESRPVNEENPAELSSVMWFGQNNPHSSVFTPVYPAVSQLPYEYTHGSLYKFEADVAWWAFGLVGNWADKMYRYIIQDVQAKQSLYEGHFIQAQAHVENQVRAQLQAGNTEGALDMLRGYSSTSANYAVSSWKAFFETIVAKYHDGYIFNDMDKQPTLNPTKMFYPEWWLRMVGYYNTDPPLGTMFATEEPDNCQIRTKKYIIPKDGLSIPGQITPETAPPPTTVANIGCTRRELTNELSFFNALTLFAGTVLVFSLGVAFGRRTSERTGNDGYEYESLEEWRE